ncbi:MAG: thioredoxin family protein [Bacilli bacterium]|nr:thioredoxin family protein [Bacilli bacterium]
MKIEIKIIGSNTHNGLKLIKNIKKINLDIKLDIKELNEERYYKKYNVKNFPGIVIGGRLVSEGKVLTEREFCKLLTSY